MPEFDLTITTPQKQLFKDKAESVNAPSEEGYMTILASHAPLLANLTKGKVTIKTATDTKKFDITDGFIEVNEKGVTILVKQ